MAFNNIDTQALGLILQTKFSDGIRRQISNDYRDWANILRKKESNSAARDLRFMLLTAYGVDAVNYANPGAIDSAFPSAATDMRFLIADCTALNSLSASSRVISNP